MAENSFHILQQQGLKFKTVTLTAKDKICLMEEAECNPDACPYAKGHYDRVNDAIYDLLTNLDTSPPDYALHRLKRYIPLSHFPQKNVLNMHVGQIHNCNHK